MSCKCRLQYEAREAMTHEAIYNSFSSFTLSTFCYTLSCGIPGKGLAYIMEVDFSAHSVNTVL